MELTKDKCKHDRYSWSKLLNEGICLDCMMRLTQYPSSQPSEQKPPEHPSKEEILDSVFGNKGLDLREITSKPLYAIYHAMQQYAEEYATIQRNEAIQECIDKVKEFYSHSYLFEELEKLKR